MKKLIIAISFLLFSASAIGGVTLVRSPYSTLNWYAYVPADNDGRYWARYNITAPDSSKTTYACITSIWYGPVRPGKVFRNGDDGYTDSANWSDGTVTGLTYRQTTTTTNYVQAVIPAGHNLIQALCYDSVSDGGTMNVTWDDNTPTTDFDITSFSENSTTGLVTRTLAHNTTSANGSRAVRLTFASGTKIRFIGFRSYNTNSFADPNQTLSSKVWLGNDIVTDLSNGSWSTGLKDTNSVYEPLVAAISYPTTERTSYGTPTDGTHEFAFAWHPSDVSSNRWSGGAAHFSASGNAPFTYPPDVCSPSGVWGQGPIILVDGVDQNQIWDDTNNPKRTLFAGDNIYLRADGFLDYNSTGVMDVCEPFCTWSWNVSSVGMQSVITLDFNGLDVLAQTDAYVGHLYPRFSTNCTITVPPYLTGSTITAADKTIPGNSYHLSMSDYPNVDVKVSAIGCPNDIYYGLSNKKIYLRMNMAGYQGGLNPTTGDSLSFGCKYEITRKKISNNGKSFFEGN